MAVGRDVEVDKNTPLAERGPVGNYRLQLRTSSSPDSYAAYEATNQAEITSMTVDGATPRGPKSNTVKTLIEWGEIGVVKGVEDVVYLNGRPRVPVADQLIFTATISNLGVTPLYDFRVDDHLPADWGFDDSVPVTMTHPTSGDQITVAAGRIGLINQGISITMHTAETGVLLEPGESTVVRFAVKKLNPDAALTVTNNLEVTARDGLGFTNLSRYNEQYQVIPAASRRSTLRSPTCCPCT